MRVKIEIKRRQCETADFYWDEFDLRAGPRSRVLDLLIELRRTQAPELAFRASCKSGQCGACAININGETKLACRTLLDDLDRPGRLVLSPLRAHPVKKDLVVELSQVGKTSFTRRESSSSQSKPASKKESEEVRKAAVCNLCGACASACPISWSRPYFSGPATLVKLYRWLQTAGVQEKQKILEAVNGPNAAWACETDFNCLEVCPRGINVTELISKLKREIREK